MGSVEHSVLTGKRGPGPGCGASTGMGKLWRVELIHHCHWPVFWAGQASKIQKLSTGLARGMRWFWGGSGGRVWNLWLSGWGGYSIGAIGTLRMYHLLTVFSCILLASFFPF